MYCLVFHGNCGGLQDMQFKALESMVSTTQYLKGASLNVLSYNMCRYDPDNNFEFLCCGYIYLLDFFR